MNNKSDICKGSPDTLAVNCKILEANGIYGSRTSKIVLKSPMVVFKTVISQDSFEYMSKIIC